MTDQQKTIAELTIELQELQQEHHSLKVSYEKDITERKQAEETLLENNELLTLFISHSPIYCYIKDVNPTRSVVLLASDNYQQMIGIPSSEMIGKSMEDLFPPEFAAKITADDWAVVSKKGKLRLDEELNGRSYTSIKFPIVQGDKTLLAGYTIDITERKQAENQITKKNLQLQKLNAKKDKLFSIIAHDLKSPFTSIVGFSNLLVDHVRKKNYDDIEEYAGIIENSSNRAMDLLRNLLEWSLSQTGGMEFKPEYIEMVSLINETALFFDDIAAQKKISIVRNLLANAVVFADKAMIRTVMRNLLSNAIKFTHSGGEIIISTKEIQGDLKVSVSDNGVGISKSNIQKLFRIDKNYTTSGTNKEKGTGLGLILCKEFIEKQKGNIWVESEKGKGSNFKFTLPIIA